jgi:glycosyltransferase involved in cell wall biosynthesis
VRIALVSTPFVAVPPRSYGGTELVVDALSRALLAEGHEVTVFATGDSEGPDVRALVPVAAWPPDPYLELLHARFATREIARGGFDVAHLHTPAAVALAPDLGTPAVYTIHHARDEALSRFYALAPPVRRVAISARQAALDPPTHHVVHHGLDPDGYLPSAPDPDPYALFLGRVSWCKGPDVAIAAAARAGVRVVVAGAAHPDHAPPGWHADALEPALEERHVAWVRQADAPLKRRLLAGALALLFPIRWEEPFGLVMIEAMLSGCPVIAFRRGAAPEVVEEGVTGHLVSTAEEMAEALRGVRGFDRARCRARARARFSAVRMASDYLHVYREAARAGAPARRAENEPWPTLAQLPT